MTRRVIICPDRLQILPGFVDQVSVLELRETSRSHQKQLSTEKEG